MKPFLEVSMKPKYRPAALIAAIVAVLAVFACVTNNVTGPDVDNTAVANQQSGQGGNGTPAPGVAGVIYKVKVGFFGGTCPGGSPIGAGQTELKVGCAGELTATPKVKNPDGITDRDATPLEHGEGDGAIEWRYDFGEANLPSTKNFSNQFNRHAEAKIPGPYRLCATVKGVVGCAEGNVLQ